LCTFDQAAAAPFCLIENENPVWNQENRIRNPMESTMGDFTLARFAFMLRWPAKSGKSCREFSSAFV